MKMSMCLQEEKKTYLLSCVIKVKWNILGWMLQRAGQHFALIYQRTQVIRVWDKEWVSDFYLTPTQAIFSYIMARISYLSMRRW